MDSETLVKIKDRLRIIKMVKQGRQNINQEDSPISPCIKRQNYKTYRLMKVGQEWPKTEFNFQIFTITNFRQIERKIKIAKTKIFLQTEHLGLRTTKVLIWFAKILSQLVFCDRII